MFGAAGSALASIVSPTYLLMIVLGMLLGLTLGALPGLGGLNGIAILLPFVFHMEPSLGIALLVSIIAVQSTGDTLSSVLLGIPGTAASQATVMDVASSKVQSSTMGIVGIFSQFLTLPSPLIAGLLVTKYGTSSSFIYAGALTLAAALLLAVVPIPKSLGPAPKILG